MIWPVYAILIRPAHKNILYWEYKLYEIGNLNLNDLMYEISYFEIF